MRTISFLGMLIWLLGAGLAQDRIQQQVQQVDRGGPGSAAEKKLKPLTKEQQLRVKQLLESAEAGTATLDGPSRVMSYSQLANAYQRTDKKKAIELLEAGLNATRDMQFESADRHLNDMLTQQLQRRIVTDFAALAPERLDPLMDQLSADTRAVALEFMVPYYGKTNQFQRVIDLVMSVSQASEMPYGSATALMALLGREHSDQVRALFVSSLASYQSHEHTNRFSTKDFPDMVAKFQDQLPTALLQQAVDEVLDQAKKQDEKMDGMTVSLASSKGAASFNSAYDFRLFQLAPALRRIDPERAEKMIQERQDVNTLSSKYPQGMNSFNPQDGSGGNMSMSVGMGGGSGGGGRAGGPPGPSAYERQQMGQIMEGAKKHPQDALASIATLGPEMGLQAYLQLARVAREDNPSVSEAALDKAKPLVEKVLLQQQMMAIQQISNVYVQLGDTDKAKSALESGLGVADRLYKKDTDGDNPNQAPKAYWASTNGYRAVLADAQKIDPAWATNLLKEIPDDGVRVFNQIAMANAISGGRTGDVQIISKFKNGGTQMMFSREEE